MPETSDRWRGCRSWWGVLVASAMVGVLGWVIVYAVRPAPRDEELEIAASKAERKATVGCARVETERPRRAPVTQTEKTDAAVSPGGPIDVGTRLAETPDTTPPSDEPTTTDLTETRRRFAQTWASVMASPNMSAEDRERFLARLAGEVFGDQADVELARAAGGDEARLELARREEAGRWLRERFAEFRANAPAGAEERRAAIRRLLDEYLARIDGATESNAVP